MTKKTNSSVPSKRGVVNIFNQLNLQLPKALQLPQLRDVPSNNDLRARFNDLYALLERQLKPVRITPKAESAPTVDEKSLANLATNAWRAKTKMVDPVSGEVREDMKRVYRHIEAMFDSLKSLGVEIIDKTNHTFDSGMALNVISFEQTPGLSKQEIKETIKPSIMWQGRLIQIGDVIVGTPQKIA